MFVLYCVIVALLAVIVLLDPDPWGDEPDEAEQLDELCERELNPLYDYE